MADWGFLQGLGQGLQGFGQTISSNAKSKLEEKLRQEREEREEQRILAREQRQAERADTTADPSQTRYVTNAEGVLMEQTRSKTGKVLEERLAPQNIVNQYTRDERKEAVSLEKSLLDMQKTQAEIEYLPIKYGQEAEKHRAYIDQTKAYTNRALRPPQPSGKSIDASGNTVVPLEKSLEETLFAERTKEGDLARDQHGRVKIDSDKKAEFLRSQEYKSTPDKNEAVELWLQNQEADRSLESTLRRAGTPEYAIEEAKASMRPGGGEFDTANIPQLKDLPPEQQARAQEGLDNLRRAERLIAAGKITKEEARQRLIDGGFPRLAQQIR